MSGVAAGQHLAVQQQGLAGFPGPDLVARHRVQVHAQHIAAGLTGDLRPILQLRRLQPGRATAVQREVGMARGRAVRDHRNRLVGGVGGIVPHLHVEHRGQAAQALGADAQAVDLFVQFEAQFLSAVRCAAGLQVLDVDRLQQGLLGQHHGLFGRAADTHAEHARRAPPGAHLRHHFQHPVDHRIGGIQHRELGLGLGSATLGRDVHLDGVARHQGIVDHAGGVVTGIAARAVRVRQDRRAQRVVRVHVGAPDTLVDHVGHAHVAFPMHVHAHLQEHGDDAGILADRAMSLRAHAPDRVPG